MLSAKTQQTELERIIEALIFSFFTYVLYIFLFGSSLPVEWVAATGGGTTPYLISVHRWRVLFLSAIAILLGFGWGYVKGHDLLLRLLRHWKITQRSSRESVWTDVFLSFGGTVQVGLGDGRSVVGWLKQYAEAGDERTLFLEKAAWVVEGVEPVAVPGDGRILLTEKSEIKYVMFIDKGEE